MIIHAVWIQLGAERRRAIHSPAPTASREPTTPARDQIRVSTDVFRQRNTSRGPRQSRADAEIRPQERLSDRHGRTSAALPPADLH